MLKMAKPRESTGKIYDLVDELNGIPPCWGEMTVEERYEYRPRAPAHRKPRAKRHVS
jgi:hypothetical protein